MIGQESIPKAQAAEIFEDIASAFDGGRPIIPLYGSGVSIDAGFPVASQLVDYLVRFRWWLKEIKHTSADSYLLSHAWPNRHDLTAHLWSSVNNRARFTQGLEEQRGELNRDAMKDELRRHTPTASIALGNLFDLFKSSQWLRDEFDTATGKIHGYTGYRSLLNLLCDRDGNLIDAFFDHFTRNRHNSTTHQFIAYVAQILGSRLILTTNFDTFIESSLREEGLDPTVYEITREGTIPSAQLLRDQRIALVKLHGGAYSLRTGFDLDDPLSSGAKAEYREYFQSEAGNPDLVPIVIALGYSGSDRRVMDILSTHLIGSGPHETLPRIIWISRDGSAPPRLTYLAQPYIRQTPCPIKMCHYREARLFLQDLYQTISRQHPVGHTHYRAFTSVPRYFETSKLLREISQFGVDEQAKGKREETSAVQAFKKIAGTNVLNSAAVNEAMEWGASFREMVKDRDGIVFYSKTDRCGCSTLLAKACDAMGSEYTTIWIDAAEFRSRASLFGCIEEALHRYDHNLTRISHPLMFSDADYFVRQLHEDGEELRDDILGWTDRWEERVAIRWLRNALRRGRYVLAIDSLGRFVSSHPAMTERTHEDNYQFRMTHEFFEQLLCRTTVDGLEGCDLGESKVFLALGERHGNDEKRGLFEYARHLRTTLQNEGFPCYSLPDEPAPAGDEDFAKYLNGGDDEKVIALVLTLASFCRRPRSLAAMQWMLEQIGAWKKSPMSPGLATMREALYRRAKSRQESSRDTLSPAKALQKAIDETLELASTSYANGQGNLKHARQPHLFRQEGGFFWMHVKDRNGIFKQICARSDGSEPILSRKEIAEIFSLFADFCHDDLYERSQDASTFMEYFYHRGMSVKFEPTDTKECFDRARWLVAALELEKEKLLARGRLTTMLSHMRAFLSLLQQKAGCSKGSFDYPELIMRLLAVYGEVCLACGHPHEALQYRLLQTSVLNERLRLLQHDAPSLRCDPDAVIRTYLNKTKLPPWRLLKSIEDWAEPIEICTSIMVLAGDLMTKLETGLPIVSSEQKPQDQPNPRLTLIKDFVRSLRMAADLLVDLGVALAEPVLLPRIDKFVANEEYYWETDENRIRRMDLSRKLFSKSRDLAQRLQGATVGLSDVERSTRALVRLLEHQMRGYGMKRYQYLSPPAEKGAVAFNADGVEPTSIDTLVQTGLDEIKSGSNSSRRKRHKCYLYLMRARELALKHNWEQAEQAFNHAESSLSRSSNPPERAAMGMVHLFRAEARLLQAAEAERINSEAQQAAEVAKQQNKLIDPELWQEKLHSWNQTAQQADKCFRRVLGECKQILRQAIPALEQEEGRVENRWRTFYNLLSAQLNVQLAEPDNPQRPDREAKEEHLFTALRFVVSGFTNTGMRSDRRIVLRWMMKAILEAYETVYGVQFVIDSTGQQLPLWQFEYRLARKRIGLPESSLHDDGEFFDKWVKPQTLGSGHKSGDESKSAPGGPSHPPTGSVSPGALDQFPKGLKSVTEDFKFEYQKQEPNEEDHSSESKP